MTKTDGTDLYATLLIMKLKYELCYEKDEILKLIEIVFKDINITEEEQNLLDKALEKYNKK